MVVFLAGCGEKGAVAGEAVSVAVGQVIKGDIVLLPFKDIGLSSGEMLQYMGADASSTAAPQIRFKRLSSGETLDFPVTGGTAKIWIPGVSEYAQEYAVKLLSPKKIDSPLIVDYNGDGATDITHTATRIHYLSPSVSGRGCTTIATLAVGETINILPRDAVEIPVTLSEMELMDGGVITTSVAVDTASSGGLIKGSSLNIGGVYVTILDTLYQGYAGGVHQATLCLNYID